MKNQMLMSSLLIFASAFTAESKPREYNVWHSFGGVLYVLTQTPDSNPVFISISSKGLAEVGMVITLQDQTSCDEDSKKPFFIDLQAVNYMLNCLPLTGSYLKTYTVTEASKIAYVLNRLKSDFTVVLSGDIKIWASNIQKPIYGTGSFIE